MFLMEMMAAEKWIFEDFSKLYEIGIKMRF